MRALPMGHARGSIPGRRVAVRDVGVGSRGSIRGKGLRSILLGSPARWRYLAIRSPSGIIRPRGGLGGAGCLRLRLRGCLRLALGGPLLVLRAQAGPLALRGGRLPSLRRGRLARMRPALPGTRIWRGLPAARQRRLRCGSPALNRRRSGCIPITLHRGCGRCRLFGGTCFRQAIFRAQCARHRPCSPPAPPAR
jgi:hypothetical protein